MWTFSKPDYRVAIYAASREPAALGSFVRGFIREGPLEASFSPRNRYTRKSLSVVQITPPGVRAAMRKNPASATLDGRSSYFSSIWYRSERRPRNAIGKPNDPRLNIASRPLRALVEDAMRCQVSDNTASEVIQGRGRRPACSTAHSWNWSRAERSATSTPVSTKTVLAITWNFAVFSRTQVRRQVIGHTKQISNCGAGNRSRLIGCQPFTNNAALSFAGLQCLALNLPIEADRQIDIQCFCFAQMAK